jgi:hypothetical protein
MKSGILWALCVSGSVIGIGAQAQTAKDHTAPPAPPTATAMGSASTVSQSRSPAASDSARTASATTLRYESSWGSADIIRGADGPVIGTVGWFRDFDVEKLVESSPRAVAEARAFKSNNFRGSLVSAIGAGTFAIGILVAGNNANNASTPILIIGGAGAIGWGLQHINIGYRSLSKALWWYNRDLSH